MVKISPGNNTAFNNYFANSVTSRNPVINNNRTCDNFTSISESPFLIPATDREVVSTFINMKNSMSKDKNNFQMKPSKHVVDIITLVLTNMSTGEFSYGFK